jgi:hypothetical protein
MDGQGQMRIQPMADYLSKLTQIALSINIRTQK